MDAPGRWVTHCCLTAITGVTPRARAGDRCDDAGRTDAAHPIIVGVRDVHGAVGGDRHAVRGAQPRCDREAAIARVALRAGTGDGRHVGRERGHAADEGEESEESE